jgi:hypothetical protein
MFGVTLKAWSLDTVDRTLGKKVYSTSVNRYQSNTAANCDAWSKALRDNPILLKVATEVDDASAPAPLISRAWTHVNTESTALSGLDITLAIPPAPWRLRRARKWLRLPWLFFDDDIGCYDRKGWAKKISLMEVASKSNNSVWDGIYEIGEIEKDKLLFV